MKDYLNKTLNEITEYDNDITLNDFVKGFEEFLEDCDVEKKKEYIQQKLSETVEYNITLEVINDYLNNAPKELINNIYNVLTKDE